MSHTTKGPGIAEKLGDHLIRLLVSEMNKRWPRQWSYTWVVAEPELKPQPSEPFSPLIYYPGASLMGMWPLKSHRASHSDGPAPGLMLCCSCLEIVFEQKAPCFHFTVGVTSYAADSDSILPLSKVVSQKENFLFQAIERRKIQEIREFKTK